MTNCNIYDVTDEGFKVNLDVVSDKAGILYIGTSKYSMLEEFEGTFLVNKYTFEVTGLEKFIKYYFYIKNTSVDERGRTGIYSQKTAIKIPIIITIGSPAADLDNKLEQVWTIINKNNPANGTGTITSIKIWANINLANCEVATFYLTNETSFSTRDTHTIGNVTAGSEQTFSGLSIDVQIGDYIGMYYSSGAIEWNGVLGIGMWYKTGDNIPCSDTVFAFLPGDVFSLGGTGE